MPAAAFRHELKFMMGPQQCQVLRQRFHHLLAPDEHAGTAGEYRVTSLYLDDAADSALFAKLAGVPHRQKWRIRIYDGQPDVLMLERKLKSGQGIHKDRVQIDREIYDAIQAGNPVPLRQSGQPLLQELAWLMTNRLLRPKVIVDYVREAYIHPMGNVRITFDKHLRSGLTNRDLFRKAPLVPVLLEGMSILEIKYDAFIPRMVQDVIQIDSLTRQAVSKYVLCRSLVKTQPWEDEQA